MMCGFVGFIDARGVVDGVLQEMTRALSHRGPDDSGLLYFDPTLCKFVEANPNTAALKGRYPIGVGFRRLSILDTSSNGHQPMLSLSGRYAIAYNGELYNYKELRRELVG